MQNHYKIINCHCCLDIYGGARFPNVSLVVVTFFGLLFSYNQIDSVHCKKRTQLTQRNKSYHNRWCWFCRNCWHSCGVWSELTSHIERYLMLRESDHVQGYSAVTGRQAVNRIHLVSCQPLHSSSLPKPNLEPCYGDDQGILEKVRPVQSWTDYMLQPGVSGPTKSSYNFRTNFLMLGRGKPYGSLKNNKEQKWS